MRILIQRVKKASVTIDNKVTSLINNGLLILIGVCDEDND
jgi:D-tyrosyl-tRNA(Tyr) deacylase